MERYLLDELLHYTDSDRYPLHMPGHKRQIRQFSDPYAIDLTEIEGFDDLHHPKGILLEAQQRAAALFGADETAFLVNGSTCGILSAVAAAARPGGSMLMARNCHKSACHAAILSRQKVSWLYPPVDEQRGICGSISLAQLKESLAEADGAVSAVLVTSPTYDGVVSDIRAIAEIVHEADAILIVDEAHGAHFVMQPYFPASAVLCGADLVVQSLHKTLPSLTQTALLHVNGDRVDREKLRRYLERYQSSSPSYVLMAGIDECIRWLQTKGPESYRIFAERLGELREQLSEMETLHLVSGKEPELDAFAFDPSRIVISAERSRLTGKELGEILRKDYHLEPEMAAERTLTAILTAADTEEGLNRLRAAMLAIDQRQTASDRPAEVPLLHGLPHPETKRSMWEAEEAPNEAVLIRESPGRISAEFVSLYPPGIPLLVPGEKIPGELPGWILRQRELGFHVQGPADDTGKTIRCVI